LFSPKKKWRSEERLSCRRAGLKRILPVNAPICCHLPQLLYPVNRHQIQLLARIEQSCRPNHSIFCLYASMLDESPERRPFRDAENREISSLAGHDER
jgi:hypothetical protein